MPAPELAGIPAPLRSTRVGPAPLATQKPIARPAMTKSAVELQIKRRDRADPGPRFSPIPFLRLDLAAARDERAGHDLSEALSLALPEPGRPCHNSTILCARPEQRETRRCVA